MRDTELLEAVVEALKWSIHGFWPVGAVLLGGPEKSRKSWLALQALISVASGQPFLGRFPVEQGDVLYLGQEDSTRRLQTRVRAVMTDMGITQATGHLHVYGRGEWPCAAEGGYDQIAEWAEDFPDRRLVIVDPTAEFDPIPSTYLNGRAHFLRYVRLAERFDMTVVLVTHAQKSATSSRRGVNSNGTSWRDQLLGRAASAADVVMGLFPDLTREPIETAVLRTTGKDIAVGDLGLRVQGCLWTVSAPGADVKQEAADISDARGQVIDILSRLGPQSAQAIADARGVTYDTAYHLLADMRSSEPPQVVRRRGLYMSVAQAEALDNPPPEVPTDVQGDFAALPYRQATEEMTEAVRWTGKGGIK